jgi:hypothetical protein
LPRRDLATGTADDGNLLGPRAERQPAGINKRSKAIMWGFLIGLYLAMIVYPLFEEWRQRRHDKKSLDRMRKHFASRRRWDVLKGQWVDD